MDSETPVLEAQKWINESILKTFDKVLDATISPVKAGFVLCGDKHEPGILICQHVAHGEPIAEHKDPTPEEAKYGYAYCAECVNRLDRDEEIGPRTFTCQHGLQRIQNAVRVTEKFIACACLLGANAHQVPKKEMPPTIRRLWRTFALCRIGPKPHTTVLSKSVGRAFALS